MIRQLIKLLVRSGNKKGLDKLFKTHGSKITADDIKFAQNLPHKSKGAPGVTRYRKEQNLKDMIEDYNVSRDFALGVPKTGQYTPVNPLKAKIRERILQMRKDPGMARGLQRMESRKASAFNTPGVDAPWSGDFTERILRRGHKLRYEPPTTMKKLKPLERIKGKARFLKTRKQEEEFNYLQTLVEGGADPRTIAEAATSVSPRVAKLVLGKNWRNRVFSRNKWVEGEDDTLPTYLIDEFY